MAYRKSRLWGDAKPPVGARLAWGDPINASAVVVLTMAEGAGWKLDDLTGNANLVANSAVWKSGKFGKALSINGSTSYWTDTNFKWHGTSSVSFAAWINASSVLADTAPIIHIGDDTFQQRILYYNALASSTQGFWESGSVSYSPSPIVRGVWNFVVGTSSSAHHRHYINGHMSDETNGTYVQPTDITAGISVGTQSFGAVVGIGSMGPIRVWRRELNKAEVLRLYQDPFAGIVSPRRRIISEAGAGVVSQKLMGQAWL